MGCRICVFVDCAVEGEPPCDLYVDRRTTGAKPDTYLVWFHRRMDFPPKDFRDHLQAASSSRRRHWGPRPLQVHPQLVVFSELRLKPTCPNLCWELSPIYCPVPLWRAAISASCLPKDSLCRYIWRIPLLKNIFSSPHVGLLLKSGHKDANIAVSLGPSGSGHRQNYLPLWRDASLKV